MKLSWMTYCYAESKPHFEISPSIKFKDKVTARWKTEKTRWNFFS